MTLLIIIGAALVAGYLLLRFNSVWIYWLIDRATRNERSSLSPAYELPRYYTLNRDGEVDTAARWPGWDGWYFFVIPDDKNLPVKMIRASMMTGLYGLEGIDSYERLPPGVSAFHAVEFLNLIPVEDKARAPQARTNDFMQRYLPKQTALSMSRDRLDVSVRGAEPDVNGPEQPYGKVSGAWPDYRFEFVSPEAGTTVSFNYHGENIVWWADVPGVFTYFAAFGEFEGTLSADGSSGEAHSIKGRGAFEHGFARKPFNFDALWSPVKLLKRFFPSFKPVRYHYELFIGGDSFHGGFMKATGFGIDFRNRGGFYVNDDYVKIKSLKIEYLDHPEPDVVPPGAAGGSAVKFYRRWKVKADTDDGVLEYVGTRKWPPAPVASNMMYYNFSYEGTYRGQSISGRGYGEYANI